MSAVLIICLSWAEGIVPYDPEESWGPAWPVPGRQAPDFAKQLRQLAVEFKERPRAPIPNAKYGAD